MTQTNPRVITFHYELRDKDGNVLDSSRDKEPMSYLEGSSQIIPGLETELNQMSTGDQKKITVQAAQAYGEYDNSLVFDVPRTQFPEGEGIKVGDQFRAGPQNEPSPVFTVTKITDSHVGVDGNHPLAGQDLFFDVEVTEVRAATQDEKDHGHAHGAGGHHHH